MSTLPQLDFALGENAEMIRDSTMRFATDKIAPLAAKIDADDWFPRDELWTAMGDLGLHGITVHEEDGGLGLGYLEHVIAVEEVSRASASIGLSYGAHSNLCVNQVRRWGNAEQKAKYLPKLISGEHVGSLAMSATACSEVSLDPPTMLVCVAQAASMHLPLAAGADFAINMLHSGQEQISRNCGGAKRGEERFDEGDWQDDQGTPWLADGQASFICRVVNRVDHGTHSVFIGEVRAAHTAEIVDPLVYVDGRYLEPAVDGRYLETAHKVG